jgi:hypothetical protein
MVARRPYGSIGSYTVYVRKVSGGPLWSQSGGLCRPPPLHMPPDSVIAPGDLADAGDHKGPLYPSQPPSPLRITRLTACSLVILLTLVPMGDREGRPYMLFNLERCQG